MATVVEPQAPEPGTWIVIPDVDWDIYEATLALWGDRPSLRFTYDGESLEVMSPSPEHDEWAEILKLTVVHAASALRVPCRSLGTATWRKKAARRGLEADAAFYLANCPRVRGKRTLDLNVDPPPDLAVEIEVSRTTTEKRMGIYASLGVPEVWRFNGERLTSWQLGPGGAYAEAAVSPSLPQLGLDEAVHWMNQAVAGDLSEWLVEFQAWVRDELAPRVQAP
jgi:Uma2 family endonuclease